LISFAKQSSQNQRFTKLLKIKLIEPSNSTFKDLFWLLFFDQTSSKKSVRFLSFFVFLWKKQGKNESFVGFLLTPRAEMKKKKEKTTVRRKTAE